MPASLLPMPRARFFNAAGLPLAGGKVFTYVAGTTTPLASFTDYNGTIANTNPVILDSVGEANIWLGNGLYKITLTDANDVVQWTVDNVGQNSVQELAAGFGIATNIASGATVDLGSIASHFANITGATTITSFGSSASLDAPLYLIKFNGALTLTNSGNLITPTGANITTANNDRAWVEYLGSGAWRVVNYMKADGTPLVVSSNGVLNVPATAGADSQLILQERTGSGGQTATLTPLNGLTANRVYTLPDLTGTVAVATNTGTTSTFLRGDGTWALGSTVDRAFGVYTATTALTALIPLDNTVPQNTEGTEILSATINVKSTTNRIRARFLGFGFLSGGGSGPIAAMFVNSETSARISGVNVFPTTCAPIMLEHEFVPGVTGNCTVRIRIGPASGTLTMNTYNGASLGATFQSTLILEEIAA